MSFLDHIKTILNLSNDEIVVVTAITPRYDHLVLEHKNEDRGIKFVAFLDLNNLNGYLNAPTSQNISVEQLQASSVWQISPISKQFVVPKMNAKIHKVLIHEYFPKAKYTIWIDGNIQVQAKSLRQLIGGMGNFDMMVFRHYTRNCIYSEAHECMFRMLDSKEKIFNQVARYTREGYPYGSGLAECPVIIRKNNRKTKAFNCLWWDEILKGSSRDQISFPYVANKIKIKLGFLPGTIINNEFFKKLNHNFIK